MHIGGIGMDCASPEPAQLCAQPKRVLGRGAQNGCGNRSDSLHFISNIGLQECLRGNSRYIPIRTGPFRVQLPSWAQGTPALQCPGQSVAQGEISGGLTEYEFAFDLPSGVYLLHFSSPTHFARSRMVIE